MSINLSTLPGAPQLGSTLVTVGKLLKRLVPPQPRRERRTMNG